MTPEEREEISRLIDQKFNLKEIEKLEEENKRFSSYLTHTIVGFICGVMGIFIGVYWCVVL